MSTNEIHPTVVIEGDVQLGQDNKILPYTVLRGPLQLGDANIIGPHTVIGTPGEDTRDPYYDASRSPVRIGSHNIIREFTAIHKACREEVTAIGDHVYVMQGVHVPHDVVLEDHSVCSALVALGGLVRVLAGANIGMGAQIRQRAVIGQYAIVAMGAAVTKNVRPFTRLIPGKPVSVNEYAINKFGFQAEAEEIRAYVLEKRPPTTAKVQAVISHYDALHLRSGQAEYA